MSRQSIKKEKTIKRYKNVVLTSCGDKCHKHGCYILLKKGKVEASAERNVILDCNKKGEIIGIDLFGE